ncbi:hypothetical protein PH7735_02976 [Shimia thalassica]|uniref:Uncharacterized protein n=1 Tax=Shimia thalassica TaxID=1715693 RepID=A0A0P1ICZ7_9RHOB|nr:hypothetical protein [Shimia thalassica]CUK06002.1 hypothetical protein PH7735_02976 [Shimia thalassica]
MSNSNSTQKSSAKQALDLLEQSYAYYQPPLKTVAKGQSALEAETYYEYVKAA